jgi:hypothetical protein
MRTRCLCGVSLCTGDNEAGLEIAMKVLHTRTHTPQYWWLWYSQHNSHAAQNAVEESCSPFFTKCKAKRQQQVWSPTGPLYCYSFCIWMSLHHNDSCALPMIDFNLAPCVMRAKNRKFNNFGSGCSVPCRSGVPMHVSQSWTPATCLWVALSCSVSSVKKVSRKPSLSGLPCLSSPTLFTRQLRVSAVMFYSPVCA